jgi:hypothetical protein
VPHAAGQQVSGVRGDRVQNGPVSHILRTPLEYGIDPERRLRQAGHERIRVGREPAIGDVTDDTVDGETFRRIVARDQ